MPGKLEKMWGRIVFISSESALQIPAEMVHYGVTKTAQLAVARGLAESFATSGVTVNSVLPGPTESEAFGAFLDSTAKQAGTSREAIVDSLFTSMRPSSLLKRIATRRQGPPSQ